MPLKKRATLPKFAQLLGQPATTVKRLFARDILPQELVLRPTGGKHWRVSFSDEDLRQCKAALAFWFVWRRKRRASKTYARRDELISTAIKLILAKPKSGSVSDPKSPEAKIESFSRAFFDLQTKPKDAEGVFWHDKILANPTNLEAVAAFILRTAVAEFTKKYGRQPTRRQLAAELEISERSIYRFPFNKNALKLAYLDRDLAPRPDEGEPASNPWRPEYDRTAGIGYAPRREYPTRDSDPFTKRTKRKLRERRAETFELAWEKHDVGNVRGGALLIFPADRLTAKMRHEQMRHGLAGTAKRHARQLRQDFILSESDETLPPWAVAAYVIERDERCRWWTNSPDASQGCTNSVSQARNKILAAIRRCRTKLPILNLPRGKLIPELPQIESPSHQPQQEQSPSTAHPASV